MASQDKHGDLSRRQFMGSSAMTTAGVAAGLSYYFSKDNVPYPHSEEGDEVKVGFIGVGSRGGALLRAMLRVPGSNIVSICDVREEMLTEKAGDVTKNAKLDFENNRQTAQINTTQNWREVIDNPDDDPAYPTDEYRKRVVADPSGSVMLSDPVPVDHILRPAGRDRAASIGRFLQGPRVLTDEKKRLLRAAAGGELAAEWLRSKV